MKIKFYGSGIFLLLTGNIFAQLIPTGAPIPIGNTSTPGQAASAWYRGGNFPGNTGASNNILGTAWNSPIYFTTGGTTSPFYRMKLNGDFAFPTQYSINGFTYGTTSTTVNTSGYLLLGNDVNSLYTNKGAFSLLHLNGQDNTGIGQVQEFGYRPWMKTGMTLTGNSDMSYMGLRQLGTGADITETAIAWADNAGAVSGPDELTFRYTQGTLGDGANALSLNFNDPMDLDGRHIARFSGEGLMGLGNTFGIDVAGPATLYARPQSLMHMSYQYRTGNAFEPYGFQQITYRRAFGAATDIIGEGEQATDGLRLGIDNNVFTGGPQTYLNSYLRWQESSNFIIQTEDGGAANIEANERLRVTSIGALALTQNPLGYDGLTAATNATRISISESGSAPLARPKSLLHLGYDYGGLIAMQGYRKWMDLGILTSNNRDHVWIGLKPRDSIVTTVAANNDRLDAVVAWGTDRQATSPTTVDNMRFIFTGHPFDANPDGAPSTSYNGLEMMRMYPASVYSHSVYDTSGMQIDTDLAYGRVGVGDFTVQGVNEEPTQKLDVVGNGRFRYLPDSTFYRDSTVNKFVMVDNDGVLRWGLAPKGVGCWDLNNNGMQDSIEDTNHDGLWDALDCQGIAGPIGTIGAHNGTSISTLDSTKVSLGNDLGATDGQLLSHREIPMNDFNIVFTNVAGTSNGNTNRLGLGTNAPIAKLDITMNAATPSPLPTGLNIINAQVASNGQAIGQRMSVTGNNATNTGETIYVSAGSSSSSGMEVMVVGTSTSNSSHIGISAGSFVSGLPMINIGASVGAGSARENIGGGFSAQGTTGSNLNRAVIARASGIGTSENTGLLAQVSGTGTTNYGVRSQVLTNTGLNIGVLSSVNNASAPANRAGYFIGALETTAASVITSDSMFKTDVNQLTGSLKLLQTVKPVSYFMDSTSYPQFNFESRKQFGFIAQQLETIFPTLVHQSIFPAQYDSLGNEIAPAIPYKSVNYTAMIPVNTQAIIELNKKVDGITLSDQSVKTNVQDLSGSLDKVLDMRGVSYDWNHNVHPELNLDSVNHVGFIAQEIQQIDPRLTYVADDSLLHVEYDKVVPILAEAIQELNGQVESKDSIINVQSAQITDLNNRLSQLENCLSGILPYLCQLSHSAIQANTPAAQEEVRKNLNVTLSNHNTIVLDQNVPNPFAEQTIINFSIPESVKKAQIHFYDANGRFMNSVEVTERGLGSVTVFGSDLSTGVYTYTLVADGQVVATKKMMKQ